ncbi:MAG: hypothetical protein HYZ11_01945 [Candidatus Tectomicrobia bacterium]|uniref:Uncharacterized protein n=1 Tax=Tectimicrobiota bacterium TaxID=2528274 RepID=A0A932HXV9_UNCTE|nr:hypothetical protein [Candidatus Tectomicrobia bacterium]
MRAAGISARRFRRARAILALALAGLAASAEAFFQMEGYPRLEPKRFDAAAVERCAGDFLVFERYEPEPAEPYVAVLHAPGFREGAVDGDVKVRVEKGKSLGAYLGRIGDFSHNYHMVSQEAGGTPICGLAHNEPSLFADVKERRIDVLRLGRDAGGKGSVMGGGGP